MSDLDDLKAMMDDATPKPDAARRAENLALAQKNFQDLQGSREQLRPTSATEAKGLWTGVTTMLKTFTGKAALTTTTALVAAGFLVMTPQGQDLLRPPTSPEITRTEFDGGIAETRIDNAPILDSEMSSDLAVLEAPIDTFDDTVNAQATPGKVQEQAEVLPSDPIALPPPPPAPAQPLIRVPMNTAPAPEPQAVEEVAPALSEDLGQQAEVLQRFRSQSSGLQQLMSDGTSDSPSSTTLRRIVINPTVGTGMGPSGGFAPQADIAAMPQPSTEEFANDETNPLKITSETPVSTFSIDVDTAAYSVVRSSLSRGQRPPVQAVRIEELINYFPYDYPAPDAGEAPFRPTVSTFQTPWNADTQLVHIALQGEMPALDDRPPLNLVFLIDTSGSMNDPAKLPLLKQSFRLMLDQLRPEDEVAIVEYAGSAGQVLAPTAASERTTILNAIQSLGAGGSTNGQGGLQQAYAVADTMKEDGQVSRIILATDGDFNVGISNPDALKDFIADKRETGTYLSVLGFGRGNLDDATMQALAQNGNGTAAYIDTLSEAQKVLVDQLTGALFPIAGDVKVQVEFNPAQVAEYRLIGYETRALAREDFNNDKVDAGELGAGHSVTAIYEITPVGSPAQLSDPLRYAPNTVAASSDELGYVKLRYKEPGEDISQLIETPIIGESIPGTEANFAAAIAGFGQLLRDDSYLGDWGYDDAISLANANRGEDAFGYRTEAVQLMRLAQSLSR